MSQFIVAGEIVKIHHYLFKAPRLRYMAGGSILIEAFSTALVRTLAERVEAGAAIYLRAAGRFMVGFEDREKAVRFAALIRFVGQHLFGGEICLVCGPLENKVTIIKDVAVALEGMKVTTQAKRVSDMARLQYMERCGECGTWGAEKTEKMDEASEEAVRLCRLCHLKYQAREGKDIPIGFLNVFPESGVTGVTLCRGGDEKHLHEVVGGVLRVSYPENPYHKQFKSFPDIAAESTPPYMGVFYADGNEMGTLISEHKELEAYKTFSDEISKSSGDALAAAADKVKAKDKDGNYYFPGLILIQGGDDLLVVLPADRAVDFAVAFMEKAAAADSPLKKGICGGLVFAPPSMPFTDLYDLADKLCTNGKNKIWFLKKKPTEESQKVLTTPEARSAIDFMLVSTSLIEDVGDMKERQIYQKPDNSYSFFTARPYRIGEFKIFTDEIRKFKEAALPRRVFMDLKDIFLPAELKKEGRIDKVGRFLEFENLVNRLGKLHEKKKDAIDGFFRKDFLDPKGWKAKDSAGSDKDTARVWQADIVEIVDFIKAEGGEPS